MTGIKCEVKVVSRQKMGNEREVTEEVYQGTYLDRGDKKYLSYKRHTEDGDIDCLLSYGAGKMTLSQQGAMKSKLEFVPGKKTENMYQTPIGNMMVPVFTRGLSVHDKKDTIEIMLDYDIATGDAIQTLMEITVTI
ncbi:Uncharacterized beta-barrel protein YwiB, DUF1934 family [Pseudobutyrivibrio sp. OR37]|uniref:DUF1934 domain-containing protein n=1 Tax=Pseudobutyrivibrio sp. OR37 TaxID=1798186 RepID=UPI0008E99214|nr:DUF1934 domain-containing protein [Pseudobutyrivibrio sp. OR37]SFH78931.1 Uncharacterized beta-barrel protein YwiB, DUF1934 family [Pseudobutyrivibrio sp. OR37]